MNQTMKQTKPMNQTITSSEPNSPIIRTPETYSAPNSPLNSTAPAELSSNAVTRAQAALIPPPAKPNSSADAVDLEIFSTIESELVQDEIKLRRQHLNYRNFIIDGRIVSAIVGLFIVGLLKKFLFD